MILHSTILGDKPKHLLIFHGLFGQADNWGTLGKKFANHYTTHLIDLRNHGKSFHADVMNYDVMSEDILNYMTAHHLPKAYLIGHSMGGKAVMQFTHQHPALVEKLVVVDIAPKAYPAHHQSVLKALKNVDFNLTKSRKDVENILNQYIAEAGVRQFLLKNVYWESEGKLGFRFNLEALDKNYDVMITQSIQEGISELPTLFLAGANSHYIGLEDEYLILDQFPNAKFKTISNAGHWIHAENPVDFFDEVVSFLG